MAKCFALAGLSVTALGDLLLYALFDISEQIGWRKV
jgi:hypothetical protein